MWNNDTTLARQIVKVLAEHSQKDGPGKMTWGARRALQTTLRTVTNPSKRAVLIRAIGDAVAKAGSATIGSISTILAQHGLIKTQITREQETTARKAIESSEAVAKKAIDAGIWNGGLTGLPTTNTTVAGQSGNKTTGKTTGSFLGG